MDTITAEWVRIMRILAEHVQDLPSRGIEVHPDWILYRNFALLSHGPFTWADMSPYRERAREIVLTKLYS